MRVSLGILFLLAGTPRLPAADGFGANTTGGAGGAQVTVANAIDLQIYAGSSLPYVITISGTISVPGNVAVSSNKTIQGEDQNATLIGDLYVANGARNVIIQNLNISNPAGVGDGDGVTIINDVKNVVVSHCTFTDCADGSLDITNRSDSVTVSWCRFRYLSQPGHRNVNLIGSSDSKLDDLGHLHVTFHHCWYDQNCDERMPSVRFGRAHAYNNYYGSTTASYGVRTRLYAECLVENNYFEHCQNPWELLTKTGSPNGKLLALGNNIAYLDTSSGCRWVAGWYTTATETTVVIPGTDSVFTPPYLYALSPSADVKAIVMSYSGNKGGITGAQNDPAGPSTYELSQNYPNPFNPSTTIRFRLPVRSRVTLGIFDLLGRQIETLVVNEFDPGVHQVGWNANVPTGTYFYRVEAVPVIDRGRRFVDTKKMILLK